MTVSVNPAQTGEPMFYLADEHPHPEGYSTSLGFWIYLMSDCLIFAILFATFGVLGGNYAAGPAPKDLFDLNLVAVNTSMLLLSSITYGFAMLTMQQNKVAQTQIWLAITGLFGLAFIGIELTEFAHMIHEGATPQRSAFLSAFFTLVGTHGLHVSCGLIWLVTLMVQVWLTAPLVNGVRATALRKRSARCRPALSVVSGAMTRNSSPPIRARRSAAGSTSRTSRGAT